MRRPEASDLVADGLPDELGDRTSTEFHRSGFALYLAPGLRRAYRVPEGTPELLVVGDRFHLKPLLQGLAELDSYHVLTLTRGTAHLYRGDTDVLTAVDVPGMPSGLAEATRFDDRERVFTSHSSARAGQGGVIAGFHGQGSRADHLDEDVMRYLRAVDAALPAAVAPLPLVLAGNPALISAFRGMTSAEHLVPGQIHGNPDDLQLDQLRSHAVSLVKEAESRVSDDLERLEEALGTGRGSSDLPTVVVAAAAGRIETMFVARDEQRWGAGLESGDEVHDVRHPGDVDLLDAAAVMAWLAGATVHVIDSGRLPGSGAAAIYRY
jgi:hypothetical protein